MNDEMVIFARTYDLVSWILPHSMKFPRPQRFVVTKRLQDATLDLQELLIEANACTRRAPRLAKLREADAALLKLRIYLRLVNRWRWLSARRYEHASERVAEIGRLLGGWIKQTAEGTTR